MGKWVFYWNNLFSRTLTKDFVWWFSDAWVKETEYTQLAVFIPLHFLKLSPSRDAFSLPENEMSPYSWYFAFGFEKLFVFLEIHLLGIKKRNLMNVFHFTFLDQHCRSIGQNPSIVGLMHGLHGLVPLHRNGYMRRIILWENWRGRDRRWNVSSRELGLVCGRIQSVQWNGSCSTCLTCWIGSSR